MFNVIDNFVSFGGEMFAINATYRKMLIDIYETVMTSSLLGAEDRCSGCKLGEAMLLSLRGNIDEVSSIHPQFDVDVGTERYVLSQRLCRPLSDNP